MGESYRTWRIENVMRFVLFLFGLGTYPVVLKGDFWLSAWRLLLMVLEDHGILGIESRPKHVRSPLNYLPGHVMRFYKEPQGQCLPIV